MTHVHVTRYIPYRRRAGLELMFRDWGHAAVPRHRVQAVAKGMVYSLPVNLLTINQSSARSCAQKKLAHRSPRRPGRSASPSNFEEQALSMIGTELTGSLFRGYTRKQWGP